MGLGNLRQPRRQRRRHCRGRTRAALAVAGVLALAPAPALAQQASDTESARAEAAILQSGQVVATAGMDFGVIAQPDTAGTVIVSATAPATCGTTGNLVRTGPCSAATFAVMGRKNMLVRLRNMSGTFITLVGPGGATMRVDAFTFAVSQMTAQGGGGGGGGNGNGNPPGTLGHYRINSDSGIANFRLGGRLNVAADQAPGQYDGVIEVQVIFN